jgi:hypothetical protein
MAAVTLQGPTYFSDGDEAAFFSWLEGIPGVSSVEGQHPDKLLVHIDDGQFTDQTLRELIAVCHRYGVGMRQLAQFETPSNRSWFRKQSAYWYKGVFG